MAGECYPAVRIGQVNVFPGETLTVYLVGDPTKPEALAQQVQLRVRPDGTPEVFWSPDTTIQLDTFKNWKPIDATPEPTDG